DFWRNSGFHLLERDVAGRLRITDDFLRAYYLRPEIHPVEESGDEERRLHAALMQLPRTEGSEKDLNSIGDADARDNYRIVLRFRDKLLEAGTLEGCYMNLFKGAVDVPPLFIGQLAHVILRNILDGCDDPLQLRAAELFFREQKATLRDGHLLLADCETVERHAAGTRFGSVGRLIVEAQGALGAVELDVLDRANAALYWERESSAGAEGPRHGRHHPLAAEGIPGASRRALCHALARHRRPADLGQSGAERLGQGLSLRRRSHAAKRPREKKERAARLRPVGA